MTETPQLTRMLLTGAGGRLGNVLRPHLTRIVANSRLTDIIDVPPAGAGEEIVQCDLNDPAAVHQLVDGCDGIIHMGGIAGEDSFSNILNGNVVGTYNIFEAARQAGVKRIFLASSNHVVGFHSTDSVLDADARLMPDSLYGASKVWSEALADIYFRKFGIETAKVRIGSCWPKPNSARELKTWLSHGDLVRLVECVFRVPVLGCPVIYGVSNNSGSWWDNHKVAHIGWTPQDSADIFKGKFPDADQQPDMSDPAQKYQGGAFAAAGHFEDRD